MRQHRCAGLKYKMCSFGWLWSNLFWRSGLEIFYILIASQCTFPANANRSLNEFIYLLNDEHETCSNKVNCCWWFLYGFGISPASGRFFSALSAAPTPSRKLPQNKTICTLHRIEIECVHRVIAVCVCGSDCPVTLLFAGPSLWLCFTNHQNVKIFIMTYNLCITNTEPKKKKKRLAEAKRKMYWDS